MIHPETYILEIINKGENDKVEFKTKLSNQHDIAKVLTAFANTEGGYLFIGVGEKGEILGLPEEEILSTLKRLTKICTSIFSVAFEVYNVVIQGKQLVYAHVDKAPKHLTPVSTGNGEFYIRKGIANIRITQETRMFSVGENEVVPKGEIIGFIAMSFREEEEPSLIDYYNAMLRAAKRTELPIKLTRIDLTEGDYEISKQIMLEIEKSDFVLADFTLSPHNVYFEAGYARGVDKQLIQTARKGTQLQFDVRNWKTIFYRNATELEETLIPKLKEIYKSLRNRDKNND